MTTSTSMLCRCCQRYTVPARDGLCRGCRLRPYIEASTKYPFTAQMDDELRRAYRRATRRPELSQAVTRLCKLWRIPRDIVLKRAQLIGVCLIPKPKWSARELDYLREWAGERSIQHMARELGRTYSGVNQKLRELGLQGTVTEGYSYKQLAGLMGVVPSKVARWVDLGWLALENGRVTHDSVEHFLWHRMEHYRFAACDDWWLKTMLKPRIGIKQLGCKHKEENQEAA